MKRFAIRMAAFMLLMAVGLSAFSFSPIRSGKRVNNQTLFDEGWTFALGDYPEAAAPDFDDKKWRKLDLPHDWSIEGVTAANEPSGNDGGYFPTGIGWYRKTFTLDKIARICDRFGLYFEGVYMNSEVYVNGHLVGKYPYGYSSFHYDITPYINKKGRNTVAVRVDNSGQKNCRWYTGSGIYRHVWLTTTNDVHIAHQGVFITTPEVSEDKAVVRIATTVKNETDKACQATLKFEYSEAGIELPFILVTQADMNEGINNLTQTIELPAQSTREVIMESIIRKEAGTYHLWSPETPYLYDAILTLTVDNRQMDRVKETFGIRKVEYSAEKGLLLNGKPIELNGGCLHHDNGPLGAASYDRAEERKVELMKAAGFNAARTAHNPPAPAFLDACDRLGMLVIDESFDGWRDSKTPHDYSTLFDEWWARDIDAMVLRDRNHPSIICWSIGNEVIERKKLEVVTTAQKLADRVRLNDPTRPVTSALAAWDSDWEIYDPLAAVHDIVGYNYMIHKAEGDHARVPDRVMWQTESYPRDAFNNWTKVADHPYVIGDFVWTSIDYLGESGIGRNYYKGESEGEHYQRDHFPWHGAYCGDIDLTGWRKPISHYRNLLHTGNEKLYMAVREPNGYWGEIKETQWSVYPAWESWNWPGHEGKNIEAEIYSRYPRIRLYLNDQLVAERPTTRKEEFKAFIALPYQPGTLRCVGIKEDGTEGETVTLSTAGEVQNIVLTPDRTVLQSDGQDLCYVTVELTDAEGRRCPNAENELTFSLKGAGEIIAVDNALLKDTTPYTSLTRKAWKGRAMVVIKTHKNGGKITLRATSPGLKDANVTVKSMKILPDTPKEGERYVL